MHTDETPYTDAGWTPELIAEFEAHYTCEDPRCENGYIEGGEYVTHTGEVDTHYWPCPVCVRANDYDEIPY